MRYPLFGILVAVFAVGALLSPSQAIDITTTNLPDGMEMEGYSEQLEATNAAPPYVWSATALPPGLNITTNGLIAGTPTVSGVYTSQVGVIQRPVVVGDSWANSRMQDVFVKDDYAFVADYYSGIRIFDVSDPSNPVEIGGYDTSGRSEGLHIVGDYAYVADYDGGLKIIDISTPSDLVLVGECAIDDAQAVAVTNGYAYVAGGWNSGLQVVDVANPAAPVIVAEQPTANALQVCIKNNHLFLADGYGGLKIFDLADPAAPSLVGSYDNGYVTDSVFVDGDIAFLACDLDGIQIIGVKNVASPQKKGEYDGGKDVMNIFVMNNYGFVSTHSGIEIIDLSDISNPIHLVDCVKNSVSEQAVVEGEYAYIANGTAGFKIIQSGRARANVQMQIEENRNRPPEIDTATPDTERFVMAESTNQVFSVQASDPEGSNIVYTWKWDGAVVDAQSGGGTSAYTHSSAWGEAGEYVLTVTVSDGLWTNVAKSWTVRVTPDNDGDGIPNAAENSIAVLDPWDNTDATKDLDGDFLNNLEEYQAGTSMTNADTDGDSLVDGWEVAHNNDPNTPFGGLPDLDVAELGRWSVDASDYYFEDMTIVESNIYIAGGFSTPSNTLGALFSVDVSNPADPKEADSLHLTSYGGSCIEYKDNTLYIDKNPGFQIVDCSFPSNLVMGTHIDCGTVNALATGSLYVAKSWNEISRYDTDDPANPTFMSSAATIKDNRDLIKLGAHLFAVEAEWNGSSYDDGVLEVFDSSSGIEMVSIGNTAIPGGYNMCISAFSNTVFTGAGWDNRGVNVIDVSDPANPLLVDSFGDNPVYGLSCQSNLLFSAAGYDGLDIWKIQDGTNLVSVYNNWIGSEARSVEVKDDLIYVLLSDGLQIYRIQGLLDTDQDGLLDSWEMAYWGNLDRDGTGDYDSDGISDIGEHNAGLNPKDDDQDGDGVIDGEEVTIYNSSPFTPYSDSDGIADGEEVVPGEDGYITDPIESDTDGDFVDDGEELALGRDPTVYEQSYSTIFFDDMESGDGNWTAELPWELAHDDYHSAFSAWSDSPWTNYSENVSACLTLSDPLDLSGYRHAWLKFWQKIDVVSNADCIVEGSKDGGASWQVFLFYGGTHGKDWTQTSIGISELCGSANVLIRFRFESDDWGDFDYDGWHIDDIGVYGAVCDINGSVLGEGSAIDGARLSLKGRYDDFAMHESTDAGGNYIYDMLVPGDYVLKADAELFAAEYYDNKSHRDEANPISLAYGESKTAGFNLEYGQSPAYIMVTSTPASASVYLDFKPMETNTPALIEDVKPGSHFVWVGNSDYPVTSPQMVGAEEAETAVVGFDLDALPGAVSVESSPESNAEVYLDFQPTGKTTPCVITNLAAEIPTGSHFISHYISVRKDGFVSPVPEQVFVSTNGTNNISFDMPVQATGSIEISSSPAGATVWLDCQEQPTNTNVLIENVSVGSHFVNVSMPGCDHSAMVGAHVSSGMTSRVHFNLNISDMTDQDGDGLPDVWEEAEGLDTSPATGSIGDEGAEGDKDRDGISNLDEYLSNTSPTDSDSVLQSDGLQKESSDPSGPFTLAWKSVPGMYYRVYYSDELSSGNWFAASAVIKATSNICTFRDSDNPVPPTRLYRIEVYPDRKALSVPGITGKGSSFMRIE